MVTDLIRATPEDDVIRRDIFDRPPIFKWTQVGQLRPIPQIDFAAGECHVYFRL